MKRFEVTNQQELAKAIKDAKASDLIICRGNAEFEISDSAQVTATDSAQITATGSAQVTAYDSAQVTAYGSAQVTAYDSAQVRASRYVAVTRHGQTAKVEGGVLIQIPRLTTAEEWLEFHGVPIENGVAVLFKAVSANFESKHGMDYTPGTTPIAPDWLPGPECGNGLHFCARPVDCLQFYDLPGRHFVACPVFVSEIVVHPDGMYPSKVKAPRVCAPTWECDIDGNPLAVAEASNAG